MLHVTIAIKQNGEVRRRIILARDEDDFSAMMLAKPGFRFRRVNTVQYGNQPIQWDIALDFDQDDDVTVVNLQENPT